MCGLERNRKCGYTVDDISNKGGSTMVSYRTVPEHALKLNCMATSIVVQGRRKSRKDSSARSEGLMCSSGAGR